MLPEMAAPVFWGQVWREAAQARLAFCLQIQCLGAGWMALRCGPALAAARWALWETSPCHTRGPAAPPCAQLSLQPHAWCPAQLRRGWAGRVPKAVLRVATAEGKGTWTLRKDLLFPGIHLLPLKSVPVPREGSRQARSPSPTLGGGIGGWWAVPPDQGHVHPTHAFEGLASSPVVDGLS